MDMRSQSRLVFAVWATLALAVLASLLLGRWSAAFIAFVTLGLTLLPLVFEDRFNIKLPSEFGAAISIFLFATLFLGEVGDFYNKYWWWDVALHTGSAIGFGLLGFIFIFMLFEGNRYAAPPVAIALVSFAFGLSIGALWEVFEFAMDQIFGLNMQKSGLIDTMFDLIVDTFGAALGATAGYFYLKRRSFGWLSFLIDRFVQANHRLFRKRNR
jgi:ABC-type Fe3+-siderophore transport system permease subunit